MVESGKSVYQDRVSKDKGYVQAHLIKAGKINPDFKREYPEPAKMMKNVLGRTQKVPCCDKIQQEYRPKLFSVDYSKPLTKEEEATLKNYQQAYIKDLNKRIKTIENYLNDRKSEQPIVDRYTNCSN